jgi:hypothetical protein
MTNNEQAAGEALVGGLLTCRKIIQDAPTPASVSMFNPSYAYYATTIIMCNSVMYPTLGCQAVKDAARGYLNALALQCGSCDSVER